MGVALDHGLDKGFVDHIHLRLAVAIGEIHIFAANNGRSIRQVVRHSPV